jgi:hypothetical protein
MALIPNPLSVRWYGQRAHASAHHEAALSIKTLWRGKGHFGLAWRRRNGFAMVPPLAAQACDKGESAMLDFLPGIRDATWVGGESFLAHSMAVTRASSTRPANTPGEPPTLALAAEAMAIVGIYLAMRGFWRVRKKPSDGPFRRIDATLRSTSPSKASNLRDRDAA